MEGEGNGMSEMVERLVLASFKAWQAHNEDKQKFTLDDMSDDEREFARFHARSMLEAMREPTKGMLEAIDETVCEWQPFTCTESEPTGDPAKCWQAAIDEALRNMPAAKAFNTDPET